MAAKCLVERVALGLVIAFFIHTAGCGNDTLSPEVRDKMDLFFSPDGEEYASPSGEMVRRLERADPGERRALLDRLIHLMKGRGACSRREATEALFGYFADEKHWPEMTRRDAEAIARYVIHVNRLSPYPFVTTEALRGPPGNATRLDVVDPVCALAVFGQSLIIRRGLPPGWRALEASVEMDGAPVPEEAVFRQMTPPDAPLVLMSLPQVLGVPPEGEIEDHTLVVRLKVRTPNGIELPVESSIPIRVAPVENWLGPRRVGNAGTP